MILRVLLSFVLLVVQIWPQDVIMIRRRAASGGNPITRIQAPVGAINSSGGGNVVLTMSASASGSAIFILLFNSAGEVALGITDNRGNSYVLDASHISSEAVAIYSCLNATSGVTTITLTFGSGRAAAFSAEYSGIAASAAFDKTAGANNAASPYSSGATTTTEQANELLLGIVGTGYSNDASIVANGSWTNPTVHCPITDDGDDSRWQEQIVSTTGTFAATGTSATLTRVHALIATYKASS